MCRFLSNDGDLCEGENDVQGAGSEWKLEAGDVVRMQIEFSAQQQMIDTQREGKLNFWKNGERLPAQLSGIQGPVSAAVCMSDCKDGDCVEIIDFFYYPDPSEAGEGVAQKPNSVTVLDKVQASWRICQACIMFIDFQVFVM